MCDKHEIIEEQLKLAKLQLVSKVEASTNVVAPIQTIVEVQPQTPKQVETSICYILVCKSKGRQEEGRTVCPSVRREIVPLSIGGQVCPADFPERFSISCILGVWWHCQVDFIRSVINMCQ